MVSSEWISLLRVESDKAFSSAGVQILFSDGVSRSNLNEFGAIGDLAEPAPQGGAELVDLFKHYSNLKGTDL